MEAHRPTARATLDPRCARGYVMVHVVYYDATGAMDANDHPDREDYDRVRALAVLAALRDGADCAAHAALGGSHGADLFDGVTADDLHRATYCLARAVEAVGGGSGAAR
jgi:hypothetical protein